MASPVLTLAVAQTASHYGDLTANVEMVRRHALAAADGGARMVVFPELALVGYDLAQLSDPALWLAERDERLGPLRAVSRDGQIWLAVGAAVVLDGGQRQLAIVVIGPDGTEWVHGKQFLHGPENDWFDPAPAPQRDLDLDGWRIALAVCYDVAVPAHAADAARRGADVYVGSALYVEGEQRRVDIHFASRAMDHRMYAALSNHSGPSPIGRSIGGSGVWSPTGERLRMAGVDSELLMITLDRAPLTHFRTG